MIQQNDIENKAYTNTITNSFYCQFLLPCGFCTRLNMDCPKQNKTYIHWLQATQVGDYPINLNKVICKG